MKKVLESVKHGTILQEDHIITILYNILCSVKFLHESNIIHRDLKPGNLLINTQCGVKIADYGLSRSMPEVEADEENPINIKNVLRSEMLDYSQSDTSKEQKEFKFKIANILKSTKKSRKPRELTEHVGSRWYRAPEIILMEKNYDFSVDLWSIGCVLDELIYCSEPYSKQQKHENLGNFVKSRASFKGTSCFPLSPVRTKNKEPKGDEKIDIEETD